MQKDLTLQEAFDAAIGKKSTQYRGYFRVNVPELNKEQLTELYKVKDTYHPEELNLKRSGTGITILIKT